jgi:diaminopimelate decarboxylase
MELREQKRKIYIRDFSFEEIAEEYGTPFYLYDLNTIKERIYEVRKEFGDTVKLFYAVKANSNLEILKGIRDDVDGLDVSSGGEVEQSLLAGYDPARLSLAGPGKTRQELQEAIHRKIGIISVESLRELQDIRTIASEHGLRANIALRLNPRLLIKEFAIKMGGKATQFGIDEEDVAPAVDFIKRNETSFNFLGIHIYAGTQCMSEEALARNLKNTLEIAAELQALYGLGCRLINLGGGFGVSYYEENKEINLTLVADRFSEAVKHHTTLTGTNARLVLELGRYLVADAGIYVARVVSEKKSRGEMFFILDGGMNHHLAASGNLGSAIRKNYIVKNLSRPRAIKQTCNLVGPLCTPIDLLARNVSIESPHLGDLVGILNSGSYAFTASPLLFLGHKTPIELLLVEDDIRIVRKRKKLTDLN